jgi:TldD protein
MVETGSLQAALARALHRGGDFADCFVERRRSLVVSMEDSRVERVLSGIEQGAGIRVISGRTMAYAYTDELTDASLLRAADVAAAAARAGRPGNVVDLRRPRQHPEQRVRVEPGDVDTDRKVDLLRRADQVARDAGGAIRQVTAGYADGAQSILVADSEGGLADDRRTRIRFFVQAVAARDNDVQSGYVAPGRTSGFEFFDGDVVDQTASTAAARALLLLDADPAPAGVMPVVIGNEFGGVLFHEASGHGLEADAVARRASVYAGRIGEVVASPLVTAVDDGTVEGGWGTLGVDDEGTPTQRNVLIQDGVLTAYMSDRLRSRQDGGAPTGNGRRQSYQHLPTPRMTNTFILPGSSTVGELIEATPHGLYAKALGSGQVNPVTGDFVFAVTEGYLIENGRIGRPVRGATLVGNGPAALQKIDMVAGDLGLAAGTCGKEGQMVAVSVGQPHVRITELTVGGTRLSGGVQM